MNWRDLAKNFIHGIAFSLFSVSLNIAGAFVLPILMDLNYSLGLIIGLTIGFGLFFLIVGFLVGFLNRVITVHLWFDVKMSFWNLFLHGLALFTIFFAVNLVFIILPTLAFPEITTWVITTIVVSYVDGFLAKDMIGRWKQED